MSRLRTVLGLLALMSLTLPATSLAQRLPSDENDEASSAYSFPEHLKGPTSPLGLTLNIHLGRKKPYRRTLSRCSTTSTMSACSQLHPL
jgi:hypothetical protein